jgi:hypothetical protein
VIQPVRLAVGRKKVLNYRLAYRKIPRKSGVALRKIQLAHLATKNRSSTPSIVGSTTE